MGKEHADPIGLAVAQAAQDAVPEATVILFGSRARGDHRPNSDVDLLVVVNDTSELSGRRVKNTADGAAWSKLSELPGKFGYDVIGITREQFGYCRRARNHIAAQALRDGVIMNYDEFDDLCDEDFNNEYPSGWPDIRQRLINARRRLGSLNHNIDTGNDDQELIGFIAQQAVENALKGWISAIDCDYTNIHRIDRLTDILRDNVPEGSSPARDELDALVQFVPLSPEQVAQQQGNEPRDWLTQYAVAYRYGGAEHELDAAGYRELKERIGRAVTAFVEEIHSITDTGAGDLENGSR